MFIRKVGNGDQNSAFENLIINITGPIQTISDFNHITNQYFIVCALVVFCKTSSHWETGV